MPSVNMKVFRFSNSFELVMPKLGLVCNDAVRKRLDEGVL
jgi:hypothetical protein